MTPTPTEKPRYTYCRVFFVDSIYSTTIEIMTSNILFSIFKQRAYVYIRNADWLCRISCSVLAVPPADGPFFHVAFYPYHRLTVHCYK